MSKKFKMTGSGKELNSGPETSIYYMGIDLNDQAKTSQAVDDYALDEVDYWAHPETEINQNTYEFKLHSSAEPIDIYNAYIYLAKLADDYSNGEKWSLSRAIALCAINGIPLPSWVTDSFLDAYTALSSSSETVDWNDVLGSPLAKGLSKSKHASDAILMPRIVYCVLEKLLDGYPIHASTFEIISEELKTATTDSIIIGSTKIKELYYTAKKRSASLKYIIRLINDNKIKALRPSSNLENDDSYLFSFFWSDATDEFKTSFQHIVPDIEA